MQADFQDAHERHWQDAELLFNAQRLANADHLYGVAVECGLKRMMQAFRMETDHRGPKLAVDRKHVNELWDRFETYQTGRHGRLGYELPKENPFDSQYKWDVAQRYASRQHFDEARVLAHRACANLVRGLIKKATMEDLL
jgi:hypothetical protein